MLFYITGTAFVTVMYRGVMRWLDAPLSMNVYAETFVNMTDVHMYAATTRRLGFNHLCICASLCSVYVRFVRAFAMCKYYKPNCSSNQTLKSEMCTHVHS